ncbi:MAG TPA: PadR family transcriptional regulator [Acidimicrobiales bacterium]|nr:PadR family transcriptional regulator [Acidimicrobiales bacterium]
MSVPVDQDSESRPEPEVRTPTLSRPAILLLLQQQEGHGYDLMKRLRKLGPELTPSSGRLYCILRSMADDGLVTFHWSTAERGPARRTYAITELGQQHLEQSMSSLASLSGTIRGMLNCYRQR